MPVLARPLEYGCLFAFLARIGEQAIGQLSGGAGEQNTARPIQNDKLKPLVADDDFEPALRASFDCHHRVGICQLVANELNLAVKILKIAGGELLDQGMVQEQSHRR